MEQGMALRQGVPCPMVYGEKMQGGQSWQSLPAGGG